VPGFICDRYNGHVYLESASRIGNKQKQTPRHHRKIYSSPRHTGGAESKDDRGTRTRNRESLAARDNYGYAVRLKFVNKSQKLIKQAVI
jgi:hypothetical protein